MEDLKCESNLTKKTAKSYTTGPEQLATGTQYLGNVALSAHLMDVECFNELIALEQKEKRMISQEEDSMKRRYISTAGGQMLLITGVGSIKCHGGITLKHVLQVEGLRTNLLSVSRLIEQGLRVTFDGDHCAFTTKYGKTITRATKGKNNL